MTAERARTDCPACGGPSRSRSYQIDSFDLHRCRLCSTEFLVQDPDRDVVDTTYWDAYKFELYAEDAVRSQYEQRYESVVGRADEQFGPLRSVLDIGCGIGNFVDWSQRRGLDATGVDLDADAVAAARERGLSAFLVSELADQVEPGSIDLVTLWDVIEHVNDPRQLLDQALSSLRPGGLVVLETPDVRFPLRPFVIGLRKVVEPIRWSDMLYYADHQIYFSARGLSTLLARAGLDVVDQQGMRSPSAKMAGVFEQWAEKGAGAGRLGPAMYNGLDAAMRATGMTNKLIMVGRRPTA